MNRGIIYIGQRANWGCETLFGIQPEDARRHNDIIGKTGSRKTTLLRNMIIQHLYQGLGWHYSIPLAPYKEEISKLPCGEVVAL